MSAVDISKYQGVISVAVFQSWKAAGVDRVIIKLGGGDAGRYEDSLTEQNHANAHAAGLITEGYWFNGTTDPAGDAVFAAAIARRLGDARIWWDVENEGAMPHWTPAQLNTAARASGLPGGAYMSSSVTFAQDWSPCTWLPLWVANYDASSVPAVGHWPATSVVMWQHTSKGHLPGYGGYLDLDTEYAASAGGTATPIPQEDILQLNAIRNYEGSIGIVDDAGLLHPISDINLWDSYLRLGIVKEQTPGVFWLQQGDGTVWNALASHTVTVAAQRAAVDPATIAASLAPLLVGPLLDALKASGVELTPAVIEAAAAQAIAHLVLVPAPAA
jgi:GH25 family lysozyme M1 (1,4-beta-N-acetylmuramidase)